MASISTLIDDFSSGTLSGIWTTLTTNGTVTTNGATLTLTPTPSATGDVRLISSSAYDLTGAGVYFALTSYAAISGCDSYFTINKNADYNNNRTSFLITDDTGLKLVVFYKVAGVTTTLNKIPYDPFTMKWLRTRESGGTIFWDYSSNGVTWTNHSSVANPWVVTSVQLTVGVAEFSSTASPGTMVIDNVNVAPNSSGFFAFM